MAGFPTLIMLLFLLCQRSVLEASGVRKELVCAQGESVTFHLNFTVKPIDSIVWTFNSITLVTIQPAEGDGNDTVIVSQSRNKERMYIPSGGYFLNLNKLMKNDSGVYRAEIHSSSFQFPITQEYGLRVYEYLSKPTVTMALQSNKNGTCMTNLTCSMEQEAEDVTYSWRALEQAANVSHNGSILPISWTLGEVDMTFICIARNPVSFNSSRPIFVQKLCEGAAGDPDSFIVYMYLLWVPILLCLLVLVLVFLNIRRERGKEAKEKKKRMDSQQEIPNFCPHSGENAEYVTISYPANTSPEEDPANMLYSTVQIPRKVENPPSLPGTPDTARQFSYENVI
uniref:SLAM family member 7 n=1 Tax=Oryctolagus cuniculus TaxID=9986 RepID=G1T5N1_RABIT|nr:SLAM family member 7 [Oryctolagus cuniculus]